MRSTIPLHIKIAEDLILNPRDVTARDYIALANKIGYNPAASSRALLSLEEKRLVEKVAEARYDSNKGRNLNVFRIIAGKEANIQAMIDKAHKPKKRYAQKAKPVIYQADGLNSWAGLIVK